MADRSKIEWTDASWTPIRARRKSASAQVGDRGWRSALPGGKLGWHCEHVTTGCEHCYAERMNKRLGTGLPFKPGHRKDIDIFLDDEMLTAPLRWRKPRMIFVCSMSDLFADFVKDEWIDRVFAVMALAPQHTFQVLTKRPERMRAYFSGRFDATIERHWPLPNVWLGISCERQSEADARIPLLLQTPAAIRFVSAEPMLGLIDLTKLAAPKMRGVRSYDEYLDATTGERCSIDTGCIVDESDHSLDWVIVGGESGPDARPMHPDWARSLRDQCAAAAVPFFFKQWGEWRPPVKGEFYNTLRGRASKPPSFIMEANGNVHCTAFTAGMDSAKVMLRVGKKAAGRLLDGVEHNGMPGRQMHEAAA
jgi:protein gp37